MKQLFQDLLQTKGVVGVVLMTADNTILYKAFPGSRAEDSLPDEAVRQLAETLGQAREADIVYRMRRIYLRKTAEHVLLILMAPDAPIALVRLKADTIFPQLRQAKKTKGIARFLKRWK